MERNDFDKRLRDRLEGVTEPAPDVWEGISQGLARRRRQVIFRRFTVAVAAAAAVVALALLVFRNPHIEDSVVAPVQIAETESVQPSVVTPEEPAPAEAPGIVPDVAPIRQQIASFTKKQAVAVAEKPDEVKPVEEKPAEETPVVETPVEETVAVEPPVAETPVVDTPGLLTEKDLPADFWDEEPRTKRTHTSQISILSNLTTVSSDGDLLYIPSAMHASSQSGKGQASSQVEPITATNAPKFYAPLTFGLQVEFPITERLSVGTGLNYSYLVSRYDMLVDKVMFEGAYNQLHYLGIPVSLSYHFVQTPHVGVYASASAEAEKCIAQRYVYGSNTLNEKVGGLQWSAKAGVGVEYWFIPRMGLYFDPSLVYFFDNKQPFSIRTQQPLQANFELGLRFKI